MILLTRTFVLFLLVVDWKEDTSLGNNPYSREWASTEICPLDLLLRDGTGLAQVDGPLVVGILDVCQSAGDPFAFPRPADIQPAEKCLAFDSLYMLMSLQL